ncbi:MAG: phosphate acetyltransferase [Bacilli bacterium]|nr:phosphate acetyltransferase [Bacilli bacterium]
MEIIERIKERAKENIKTIVLPEADDIRVLKAARTVTNEGFAKIILVGEKEKVEKLAKENNIDINDIFLIDPKTYDKTSLLINEFYNLRKEKGITEEQAKNIITNNYLYFGCMLVKLGFADGQVSGAKNSSADTLRPALQIIKTSTNTKVASCFFLMSLKDTNFGSNGTFIYSDCGMIQNPTSQELVEIAKSSADTFKLLVEDTPNIAFLSHSTLGTSKCDDVYKVQEAVKTFKENYKQYNADGEMQFDCAIIPEVAKIKAPNSKVAGHANVLIFPNLDSGNIGYKITERLAHAKAYGPITQGLKKPVNDLSRGCNENDIVGVIAITALQANNN